MASHKSALKKLRRDEKKRMINKINRSKMRNKIKQLKKSVAGGQKDEAKTLFANVVSVIDGTASKGTIHPKTASRYKSRITQHLRKSGIEV